MLSKIDWVELKFHFNQSFIISYTSVFTQFYAVQKPESLVGQNGQAEIKGQILLTTLDETRVAML